MSEQKQEMDHSQYLVSIEHERLSFFTPVGEVKALNDVSLHVAPGEVLGIVGESGSGKSVTSYSLMGLTAYPGRIIGGDLWFNGHHINDMTEKQFQKMRGSEIAIIFQDPMTSLNPVYTIGNQIREVIMAKAKQLLADAGYPNGEGFPAITYSINDAGYHKAVAEYVQAQWQQLGLTVNVETVEWKSFLPQRRAGNYQISRNGWVFDYNDPSNILDLMYSTNGNNDGKYNSADFDAAMDAARSEVDPEKRSADLHKAEDVMIYTQIPREKIFKNDSTYTKLGGDADAKTEYKYTKWEKLGYLDFVEQKDMCAVYTGSEYNACMEVDSDAVKTIVQDYVNKGYTSAVYTKNGLAYVYKDKPVLNIVWNFYHNMYAGQIIEYGLVDEVFYDPKHPYTWGLLSSLPQLGIKGSELYAITGTPPSLFDVIKGDAFAPRNPYAMEIDFEEEPPFFKVSDTHYAKTWLLDPRAPKVTPPQQVTTLHERALHPHLQRTEPGAAELPAAVGMRDSERHRHHRGRALRHRPGSDP